MPRKKAGPAPGHDDRRAALYVRVSTRHQIDKDSLPFQRKKLKEYCKLLDICQYQIFEDDGYSAKNTDRPNFQEMMNHVRNGEFTHLIVWKVDRVSRNLLDFTTMYQELKDHKVTFISMNEQFDTSTAIGGAMLKIILIFAELEREMTSERVTAIMINRAEGGLWNGSRLPIGYKLNRESMTPEPDPDEKDLVQLVFDEYEKQRSCHKVARYMQSNHVKLPNGRGWNPKLVRDMIHNQIYIGNYVYNKRENHDKIRPESEWIVRENNHPSIISRDQFDRCNKIMNENAVTRDVSEIRQTKHIHVFGGKLICNMCGGNMSAFKERARKNGFRPSLFRCSRRTRMMDCENKKTINEMYVGPFVLNYVSNLARIQKDFKEIDSPEKLAAALISGDEFKGARIAQESLEMTFSLLTHKKVGKGAYMPDLGESASEKGEADADRISYLEKEMAKCKNAISRLTELYLFDPDSMTKEEFSARKREISGKIRELESQIDGLKSGSGAPPDLSFIKKASAFLMAQHITKGERIDYGQLVLDLDNEIIKDFIDQIIDEISVQDGRIVKIRFASGLEHDFVYPD